MGPETAGDRAVGQNGNGRRGLSPYRNHTAFMDLIADQYDANDSALRRTVEHIKDALDPAGILAPTSGASGRPAALTAPT